MSYSFNVRAATATEVLEKVRVELDKVVASQPIHVLDRDQAFNAAKAFVRLLPENVDGHDFEVSVHGSIGRREDKTITGAGIGVSAHLAPAEAKATAPVESAEENPAPVSAAPEPVTASEPAPVTEAPAPEAGSDSQDKARE